MKYAEQIEELKRQIADLEQKQEAEKAVIKDRALQQIDEALKKYEEAQTHADTLFEEYSKLYEEYINNYGTNEQKFFANFFK